MRRAARTPVPLHPTPLAMAWPDDTDHLYCSETLHAWRARRGAPPHPRPAVRAPKRFPRELVDAVKAAVPLSSVAARYTALRPTGDALEGLCPLHEERTASFRVDDGRGAFKCFGCGVGGDHLTLIQEAERVPFVDAFRRLAEMAGVELEDGPASTPADGPADRRRRALAFAARFYHGELGSGAAGRPAREYLRARGFGTGVLRAFYVGYAPTRSDRPGGGPTPLAAAAAAGGVALDDLVAAGLVRESRRGGGHYDVFRGRVVFPVLDPVRGHVLGFAGRRLDRPGAVPDDHRPKYVNTSEACGYEKKRALFGLYQARRAAFGAGETVLVEGYADVLALRQAGVENVVAAGGTAFTGEQARALHKLGERVLVVYDGDAAGQGGAADAVRTALGAGLRPRVVTLPPGEDPASFLAGAAEVADAQTALDARSTDGVDFVYRAVRSGRETVEGHLEALRAVVEALGGVADPLTREVYLHRVAEVSGTRAEAIEAALGWSATATGDGQARTGPPVVSGPPPSQPDAERP